MTPHPYSPWAPGSGSLFPFAAAILSPWIFDCKCAGAREKATRIPGHPSEIAVDTASRPHYNTPAYRRSRLCTFRLTDQGFAHEQRAGLLIRTASRDDLPPRSHPFCGEATTPDPRLISSPGGGASPYSTLMPGLQRPPYIVKRQAMPL